jgi:hypothetical protein
MNRERLEQMVAMLRELPPETFNLTNWQCGTTACAVGHACLNPVFKEQGLNLRIDENGVTPAFEGALGWFAVEKFFGLNEERANHFFHRWEYPNLGKTTAAEVADRIESFLQNAEGSNERT